MQLLSHVFTHTRHHDTLAAAVDTLVEWSTNGVKQLGDSRPREFNETISAGPCAGVCGIQRRGRRRQPRESLYQHRWASLGLHRAEMAKMADAALVRSPTRSYEAIDLSRANTVARERTTPRRYGTQWSSLTHRRRGGAVLVLLRPCTHTHTHTNHAARTHAHGRSLGAERPETTSCQNARLRTENWWKAWDFVTGSHSASLPHALSHSPSLRFSSSGHSLDSDPVAVPTSSVASPRRRS